MIHNDPLRELDLNMTRRQLFGKTACARHHGYGRFGSEKPQF